MYGDQFGEFVCGYWGLKGKVCPHSCYNQCVLYLNFIIKPTVDKRSSSLLWPECHGPLEVTETAFQCSVSLWATINPNLQGPVVRMAVSAKPGLNFNPGYLIMLSKELSRIIFSILFRVSNHQIVGKEN